MSEPIDKEWMSENERGGVVYSLGVEVFLKFAEWKLGGKKCPCPCKKCRNRYWLTYKEVGYHLISKEKTSDDDGFEMGDTEEETIGHVGIGMRNFVDSAFGLHGDAVAGDDSLGIEFDEPYVPEPDLGKRASMETSMEQHQDTDMIPEGNKRIEELQQNMFNLFFRKKLQKVIELDCINGPDQVNGPLTLMGKLYGGHKIQLEDLSEEVHRLWQTKKEVCLDMMDRDHIRITFEEESERAHVLANGPWNIYGYILSIKEWRGDHRMEDYNFDFVKFWVQIWDLLKARINQANVWKIGAELGSVCEVDLSCPPEFNQPVARVRIEMDIKERLTKEQKIKLETGDSLVVRFKYEKLEIFCYFCGVVIRHDQTTIASGHNIDMIYRKEGYNCFQPKAQQFFNGIAFTGKQRVTIVGEPQKLKLEEMLASPTTGGKGQSNQGMEITTASVQLDASTTDRIQHNGPPMLERIVGPESYGPEKDGTGMLGLGQDKERGQMVVFEGQLNKMGQTKENLMGWGTPTEVLNRGGDWISVAQKEKIGTKNRFLQPGAQHSQIKHDEGNRIRRPQNPQYLHSASSKEKLIKPKEIQHEKEGISSVRNQNTEFQFQSKATRGRGFKTKVSRGKK
ncbi:hypothetical protein IFM89_014875 [Coptis chinensis]|uniref:DUF4283 domain-containing protein n=1 Tax=Coptis chinensis TaxID=261450 RepID=A0A835I7X0_9MAGN|nr:hypothetical protein IFM89_014875 [Coptis chinensis]